MNNAVAEDIEIISKFKKGNFWGLSTCINLTGCNPQKIKDASYVKKFAKDLCDFIEMKRFGETVVVDFGEDPRVSGFSMTQLIETSLVSGHFVNQTNDVYLDIFSCKEYPPYKAMEFCAKYFDAKSSTLSVVYR